MAYSLVPNNGPQCLYKLNRIGPAEKVLIGRAEERETPSSGAMTHVHVRKAPGPLC